MKKHNTRESQGSSIQSEHDPNELLVNDNLGIITQKSCWHKFDDWFWYNHHALIEFQVNAFIKPCLESKIASRVLRRFLCAI